MKTQRVFTCACFSWGNIPGVSRTWSSLSHWLRPSVWTPFCNKTNFTSPICPTLMDFVSLIGIRVPCEYASSYFMGMVLVNSCFQEQVLPDSVFPVRRRHHGRRMLCHQVHQQLQHVNQIVILQLKMKLLWAVFELTGSKRDVCARQENAWPLNLGNPIGSVANDKFDSAVCHFQKHKLQSYSQSWAIQGSKSRKTSFSSWNRSCHAKSVATDGMKGSVNSPRGQWWGNWVWTAARPRECPDPWGSNTWRSAASASWSPSPHPCSDARRLNTGIK